MITKLIIICAWCGRLMGEKDGEGVEGITHSICPVCLKEQLAEVAK